MSKILLLISIILLISNVSADDATSTNEYVMPQYIEYKLQGLLFEVSYFKQFQMGLGYTFQNNKSIVGHFAGYSYGANLSYRFKKDCLILRPYFNLYGSGYLFGLSSPVLTDFKKTTIGLSPEIGISVFGIVNIIYRYNFYLENEFNNHEICFTLLKVLSQTTIKSN